MRASNALAIGAPSCAASKALSPLNPSLPLQACTPSWATQSTGESSSEHQAAAASFPSRFPLIPRATRYYSDNDEDGLDMRKALPRDVHKVRVHPCMPLPLPLLTASLSGKRCAVQEDVHVGGSAGRKRVLGGLQAPGRNKR